MVKSIKILFLVTFIFILSPIIYSQTDFKIVETFGEVEILSLTKDYENWKSAKPEDLIKVSDKIRTGRNSFATLIYDESKFTIKERSIVELSEYDRIQNIIKFRLIKGKFRGIVISLKSKQTFLINTPNAVIEVSGTDFALESFNNASKLYVFDGTVNIANSSKPEVITTVSSGKMVEVVGNSLPSVIQDIPESIYNEYNVKPVTSIKENKEITPQPAVSQIPKEEPKEQIAAKQEPSFKTESVVEPKKELQPKKEEPKKEEPEKEPWCPDPKLEFHINFDFQYLNINKKGYGLVAFIPEFGICKIGFGFYLPIIILTPKHFFYSKKWYNHNEWDFASPSDSLHDFIIKFIYVRYGQKGEPIYIRVGSLPSVTFGNGFIMRDYSNMLDFPKVRRIGLEWSLIYKNFVGIDGMISDLSKNEISGYRIFVLPFGMQNMGIISKLQVGVSLISDTKTIDKKTKVINWGFDAGLPLINTPLFNMRFGIDWATYSVYAPDYLGKDSWEASGNFGFASGFRGNLAFLIYRAEYRYLLDDYIPEYFDNFYEIQRKEKFLNLISMYTNKTHKTMNGYLVNAGTKIGSAGEFGFIFQEYYNKHIQNKATVYLTLERGIIPYGYGTVSYNKVNVVGLTGRRSLFGNLYDENTILTFDGGIKLIAIVYLKLYYQRTYEKDETGKLISKETWSTGITAGF